MIRDRLAKNKVDYEEITWKQLEVGIFIWACFISLQKKQNLVEREREKVTLNWIGICIRRITHVMFGLSWIGSRHLRKMEWKISKSISCSRRSWQICMWVLSFFIVVTNLFQVLGLFLDFLIWQAL
jgi:hypothetical protein